MPDQSDQPHLYDTPVIRECLSARPPKRRRQTEARSVETVEEAVARAKAEAENVLQCWGCENGGLYCKDCDGLIEGDYGQQFGDCVCTACGGRAWGAHYGCYCACDCPANNQDVFDLSSDDDISVDEEEIREAMTSLKAAVGYVDSH